MVEAVSLKHAETPTRSIKAGRCTKWTLVTATATHEYVDGPAGLALGGLTDPRRRRVAHKTTTQTAATVGCRDAALIKL